MADRIRIGGLMRCCIQTLQERTEPGREGDTERCQVAKNSPEHTAEPSMRFRAGAWEWINPYVAAGSQETPQ